MSNESPKNPKEEWKKHNSDVRAAMHEKRDANPNMKAWLDEMRGKKPRKREGTFEEPLSE